MYKAIDVFSGTGGISLALKEFNIATVQYCEILPKYFTIHHNNCHW